MKVFFKKLLWLICNLLKPSIRSATTARLMFDGKYNEENMKTLRLGMSLIVLAVLNGGYELGTENWELSDTANFTFEPDKTNPLSGKITYNKDAATGVSATITFKCDANQEEGKDHVAELMAVGTVVGLAADATALELQFQNVPVEAGIDSKTGTSPDLGA